MYTPKVIIYISLWSRLVYCNT